MSEQQDNLTPDEQEQAEFTQQPPIDADPDAGFQSFDTDPALEEQMIDPNAETRDQVDSINQSLNPAGMMDTFNQPGAGSNDPGLDFGLPDMPSAMPLVDAFDHAFPMRMLSFTSGTGGKWVERIASGTSMIDFTEGRFVSSITSAAGAVLVGIGETDFVSVEQIDPDGYHYPAIPSGIVDCYLTNSTIGKFDAYIDAAKSIKIATGQTLPATPRGYARLVDKKWRLAGLMPIPGSITASGGGPVLFNYTGSTYDGVTLTPVRNGMETVQGTPGKLGITVYSTGTTSGGCTVKAIGVGAEVLFWPDPTVTGGWMFSQANSAE